MANKGTAGAAAKKPATKKAAPKAPAFSFDGAVTEEAPYIPTTAFSGLVIGCILSGTIAYVERYQQWVKAAILINGHTTRITLWDTTMEEAMRMVGDNVKLKFTGMNDEGYPVLYVRW